MCMDTQQVMMTAHLQSFGMEERLLIYVYDYTLVH